MNWFDKLFDKMSELRFPYVDFICRFKACSVAASYRAQTGYTVGVASGWMNGVPHAQACLFPDDERIPLKLYLRTMEVGVGDWDKGFKPDRFYDLIGYARNVFYID